MSEFLLKILVPGQLASRSAGRYFLHLVMQHFPHAIPERFGKFEPLRNKFDAHNVGSALDLWGTGTFIAERRHPRAYFMVSFWPVTSKKHRHSSISFFQLEADAESVHRFLIEASEVFGADYAVAHPLTRVEMEERIEQNRERNKKDPAIRVEFSDRVKKHIEKHGYVGLTRDQLVANVERVTRVAQGGSELGERETRRIRDMVEREGFTSVLSKMILERMHIEKYLPDLFWINVFGRPYIDMFGRERIMSAPVAQVHELTKGISIRLTKELEDNVASWRHFKLSRDSCKSYLGSCAFFDPSAPPRHSYRIPNFVLKASGS